MAADVAWLAQIPRKVQIACLATILAAGALFWAHHAGYQSGRLDERLADDRAKVLAASKVRATAGAAVAVASAITARRADSAAALHDSVRIVDTVTITLPALAGSVSMKEIVTVPPIIIRRIVADSLLILAQASTIAAQKVQIAADSSVIDALTGENRTLVDMKTPVCGGKCKAAVAVGKVAIVAGAVVQVVRWLKPGR